jgi:hypothetical protein
LLRVTVTNCTSASAGLLSASQTHCLSNWFGQWCLAADPFPNLQAIDRNIRVRFETQSHTPVPNLDHRDLDHALKAYGSPNHYCFVVFPRQDQHGIASILVTDSPRLQKRRCSEPYRIEGTKKADVA